MVSPKGRTRCSKNTFGITALTSRTTGPTSSHLPNLLTTTLPMPPLAYHPSSPTRATTPCLTSTPNAMLLCSVPESSLPTSTNSTSTWLNPSSLCKKTIRLPLTSTPSATWDQPQWQSLCLIEAYQDYKTFSQARQTIPWSLWGHQLYWQEFPSTTSGGCKNAK